MTEQELKKEKQTVKAYVATLQSLDNPFSDHIELLPENLAAKARKYIDYNNRVTELNKATTHSAAEIDELKDRCRLAFQDYNAGLTDLLARHGYTFGQRDSLQHNLNRRLEDLMEDYRVHEGPEAEPLLVDYTYRTPASQAVPNVAEYNQGTAQLYGQALLLTNDEPVYLMPGGIDALRGRFTTQQPGDPMQITQIRNLYGAAYEIEITEELSRSEIIEAGSRREAEEKLEEMIMNDEIVLDWDDYFGACIGRISMDGGAYIGKDRPVYETGPDGAYTVRVSEFLQTTVTQEGTCREDAEQRVLKAYKEQDIVLNADDYVYREIVASYRITEQRQLDPKAESSLADLDRISNAAITTSADKTVHSIRCRIDGEQQMARRLKAIDLALLNSGQVTREELALNYFKEELNRDPEQEMNRGMHR